MRWLNRTIREFCVKFKHNVNVCDESIYRSDVYLRLQLCMFEEEFRDKSKFGIVIAFVALVEEANLDAALQFDHCFEFGLIEQFVFGIDFNQNFVLLVRFNVYWAAQRNMSFSFGIERNAACKHFGRFRSTADIFVNDDVSVDNSLGVILDEKDLATREFGELQWLLSHKPCPFFFLNVITRWADARKSIADQCFISMISIFTIGR